MSYAKVYSAQTSGLEAHIIDVEVDILRGLYSFTIVGLPDKAVEESRDRVSAAVKNSGYDSPKKKNQKIVISLAPANLKKEGPVFDVAIALAYLKATQQVSFDEADCIFIGELALDGTLRPVRGVLALVRKARKEGMREIYVPQANIREAAIVDGIDIYPVKTLKDLATHLDANSNERLVLAEQTKVTYAPGKTTVDFSDVRGQEIAKRGMEIAAAGGHNIAMYGPPGTGKTMLARAFCGILPSLSLEEILEVTSIHSIAGTLDGTLVTQPPFRSPHHTTSYVAMVGGGTYPRPGEVTLAHRGVLFLDEFPEFEKRVIETLRQPLEDRIVSISRAKASAVFPANFILVAAMNPYPKAHYEGDRGYSALELERYRRKLSGPIIDRIDLWVEVAAIEHDKLSRKNREAEQSSTIRTRVEKARERQHKRFNSDPHIRTNSEMGARDIDTYINLSDEITKLLNESAKKLDLSARSYHRVIKIARTIADLEGKDNVTKEHMLEALQYRPRVVG